MLDLNDFYYFVQVVDRGGFTAAGRALRVPKSTLSHRIQQLEAGLGARLLNRTTRRFGMTDAGTEFYRHALGMLQQAEQAENAIRQRLAEPSGTIRLTTPVAAAQFAMKQMIPDFIAHHPKVAIVQHVTDTRIDIVGENYDIAVRAHSAPLPNSTLVQRILAPTPWFLFAGSGWVERYGSPAGADDLAGHASLLMQRTGMASVWRLRKTAEPGMAPLTIPIEPCLVSDDMVVLKQAARSGLGIVALPGYVCREDVLSGDLVRLLPGWSAGDASISALIPFRHGLLPSVRAFIDHLVAEFPKVVLL